MTARHAAGRVPAKQLLTVEQAAERLQVPAWTVRSWVSRDPSFPSFKIGKHRRICPNQLDAWLQQHASNTQEPA